MLRTPPWKKRANCNWTWSVLLAETSILFIQVQIGLIEEARQGLPGLMESARERKIAEVETERNTSRRCWPAMTEN